MTGTAVTMTGEGIAVDDPTGNICFTGTYKGNIAVPFQLSAFGINPLINTATTNAYMICADIINTAAWSRMAEANPGAANGYAVDIRNSVAYFTGNFDATVTISTMPANPYVHVGGPGIASNFRTYVSAYNQSTGAGIWTNVTQSPTFGSHTPTAIALDKWNNFFISGVYDGEMSYYSGTPASGNLISTGGGPNGYILRGQIGTGVLRSNEVDDYTVEFTTGDHVQFTIKAIPNPTTGLVELVVQGMPQDEQPVVQIFDLMGAEVYAGKVTSERYMLDLGHLPAGTYLLRVIIHQEPVTIRIVKI